MAGHSLSEDFRETEQNIANIGQRRRDWTALDRVKMNVFMGAFTAIVWADLWADYGSSRN